MNAEMVFDKSMRSIDKYGRMHVEHSNISKATVNPYYGREIPGYEELGLDPDRIYQLLRDPEELEKGAKTFSRLPILSRHVPISAESLPKELIVGSIGSDVSFNSPFLVADLCIWDESAIAGIDTEIIHELSSAYWFQAIMEPGEFEGQAYDGRMTQIEGNHLALVERGRAGSDVVVADRNPFQFEDEIMKLSPIAKLLMNALSVSSPKLAMDSKLPKLAEKAGSKEFDRTKFKDQLIACDGDLDPQKVDNLIDSILGVEQQDNPNPVEPIQNQQAEEVADESPEDKMRALLAGKVDDETLNAACALLAPAVPATDEDPEDKWMKPDEVKTAMDSAIAKSNAALRKQLLDAAEAARDVRSVIGDVVMDSAEDVYAMALDHLKIDHKGVTGTAALRALFKVANGAKAAIKVPAVAQDSAGLHERFPAVKRFRLA